jgi:hypothetical protein
LSPTPASVKVTVVPRFSKTALVVMTTSLGYNNRGIT